MVAPRHRRAARRSIADEPARCRINDDPVGAIWGKILPQIALSGFVTSKAYFAERGLRLEPSSQLRRHFQGQGILNMYALESLICRKLFVFLH